MVISLAQAKSARPALKSVLKSLSGAGKSHVSVVQKGVFYSLLVTLKKAAKREVIPHEIQGVPVFVEVQKK